MATFKLKVVSPCGYTSCFLTPCHAEHRNALLRESIKKLREEYAWLAAWKEEEKSAALPQLIAALGGFVSYFSYLL